MIIWSVVFLLAAMAGGAVLLARRAGWLLRIAHGGAGGAGLLLLIVALSRGRLHGAIATDAACLVAAGFALGLTLAWQAWRHRRPPNLAVFLHATLGGLGVLLLAGLALG